MSTLGGLVTSLTDDAEDSSGSREIHRRLAAILMRLAVWRAPTARLRRSAKTCGTEPLGSGGGGLRRR